MEFNIFDESVPTSDDRPAGAASEDDSDLHVEINFQELEIVAYVGELKIVGTAHFGHTGRASSQRSSDYLRRFADTRLTLSKVRIYRLATNDLIDTTPFIILNLDRVDLVYAREIDVRTGQAVDGDEAAAKGGAVDPQT
jgi:hypothetical protein